MDPRKNKLRGCGLDSYGSRQSAVAGSYEHINTPLGPIKCGEFLD